MNKKNILVGVTSTLALCATIPALANINKTFTKVSGSSDYTVTFTPDVRNVVTDGGNSAWIAFDYNGESDPVSEDAFGRALGFSIKTTSRFNFVKSVKVVVKAFERDTGFISASLAFTDEYTIYDLTEEYTPSGSTLEDQEIVFNFSDKEQSGNYIIHMWNVVKDSEYNYLPIKSVSVTYTC